jgi:dipeptidyl aminopeptidase/acylaminoacyl peptidase
MRYLVLLLTLFLTACGPPFRVQRDLSYDPNTPDATFDFYEPTYTISSPRPLIIAIHGGAWQGGDKHWGEQIAEEFCPQGYIVCSINYRLAPEHRWPAQIDDCQAALRFFRSSEWMNVDNERIAALGHSAGGHLASMLALRGPDRVTVAISANGEGDLVRNRDQDSNLEALLGPGPWPEGLLEDVSPSYFVRQDVNLLLIHSIGDTNVSYDHSADLFNALLLVNANVDLIRLSSGNHNSAWKDEYPSIHRFLRLNMP